VATTFGVGVAVRSSGVVVIGVAEGVGVCVGVGIGGADVAVGTA